MLIDWIVEGFGAGVKIWFAAVAVIGLTGAVIALGMLVVGGRDED